MRLGGRGRRRERGLRAGDRLPYDTLVDDHTVLLRDGSLLQVLHLQGLAFETADVEDLNQSHAARDMALRSIAASGLSVHHHVVRRHVEIGHAEVFDDPVCSLIERRWHEHLAARPLFINDMFLSLMLRRPRGRAGLAKHLGNVMARGVSMETERASLIRKLRELDAARETLASALADLSPRPLTSYETPHGICSEPAEFLSALFHGEMRPVLAPEGDLGRYLPYQRISFGYDAIEMEGAGGLSAFAGILSLKEYPAQAMPGMTDAILRLPYAITLSEGFSFVERQIGLERISLGLRRLRAADDDTNTLRRGLNEAKDDLAAGKTAFGEHHFSLLVRAPTLDGLDAAMSDCASALADFGATPVRETINLEAAFWAQFPGNEAFAVRRGLISTAAFSGLASLHGFPQGAETNHWGAALSILETTAATPYHFNLHIGDLGHFTIIGPSGSGKTVMLNFIAAQAQKVRPRTVFFDKDRGAEIFLRAIGGRYTDLRAGEACGFNPLQLSDTPANRAFLHNLIVQLVAIPGTRLDADEDVTIARAVASNFDQDPAYRRLRYFWELLGGSRRPRADDLAARLAPWFGDGEYAWLFDNAWDELDMAGTVQGFDITTLLDTPKLRTPALMYLFHRVEETLDGNPALILIDEGWKALDDPVFAARIRDWLKTLRKRNAAVGFGTQSARDALESSIGTAIVEQAATQIFMPNPRAQARDYCAGFGLTGHELELVRGLPPQSHCFLVKQGTRSVVARLDLSAMPDLIGLLSGREASVRELDRLRESLGDSPENWWQKLIGTPFPGPHRDHTLGPAPLPPLRVVE